MPLPKEVAAAVGLVIVSIVVFALIGAAFLLVSVAGIRVKLRKRRGLSVVEGEPKWNPSPAPHDSAPELQASLLVSRLRNAAGNQEKFSTLVRPRLRGLAVETLRRRGGTHDLSDLDDPRARAALGDELHALLTDPAATLPSPRKLAELLDRLEGQ